jgi:predicted alpha/beta-fold hydrolase
MSNRAPAYPAFRPRAPWLGPDLQTLRNVLRGPALQMPEAALSQRLELPMRDGSSDRLVAELCLPGYAPRSEGPLIVLIHGLGGSSGSPYVHTSSAALLSRGDRVLKLNLRGAGESRALCRGQYHAGRTADLRDALEALPSDLVSNGVVVVGFSLGGNMALKFAAEHGGLRGVVSVSAPIDLAAASRRFLALRNRAYHAHLLGAMKREASAAEGLSVEERETIRAVRTIYEFDEQIVAPVNGYASAAAYYEDNHAARRLQEIEVPTLLVQARDDPWIPDQVYREFSWSRNPNLCLLLAQGGGHLGFHARGMREPWHDTCLSIFIDAL